MSVDISASMIYGIRYSDLPAEDTLLDSVNKALNDGTLDYTSPWYDAPMDCWIIGTALSVDTESTIDLLWRMQDVRDAIPVVLQEIGDELTWFVSVNVM